MWGEYPHIPPPPLSPPMGIGDFLGVLWANSFPNIPEGKNTN